MNEARKALYEYLRASGDAERTYVFTSQRSERLTEEGIHYWFRTLKARAMKEQWEYIHDLTFHDLRHDFAHRAREGCKSFDYVSENLAIPRAAKRAREKRNNKWKVRYNISHGSIGSFFCFPVRSRNDQIFVHLIPKFTASVS